jgi:hypothetical protein
MADDRVGDFEVLCLEFDLLDLLREGEMEEWVVDYVFCDFEERRYLLPVAIGIERFGFLPDMGLHELWGGEFEVIVRFQCIVGLDFLNGGFDMEHNLCRISVAVLWVIVETPACIVD